MRLFIYTLFFFAITTDELWAYDYSLEEMLGALDNAQQAYFNGDATTGELIHLEALITNLYYVKKSPSKHSTNPLKQADCAVAHQMLGDTFYSKAHALMSSLLAINYDFDLLAAMSIMRSKYNDPEYTEDQKKRIAHSVIQHGECFLIL